MRWKPHWAFVRQHVAEKAADELGDRQGHGLVPITVFGSVVLVVEGDLVVVEGDRRIEVFERTTLRVFQCPSNSQKS